MIYQFDFSVLDDHIGDLLMGCWWTLQLSAVAIVGSLLISVVLSLGLRSGHKHLHYPINAFIEVVRNTPFLVQIFLLFFGLPMLGMRLSPSAAAVIALVINGAAYTTEIIRGGLESISKGQTEAGYALGLRPLQVFGYVVLKPAIRAIYPSLTSQFIYLMLTSSVVSSISAHELTHVAAVLEGQTFRSFEIYFVVAGLYLALSVALSLLFKLIYSAFFSYPSR